ncbi:MAG: hypothetical protein LWX00_04605 [Spirochaetia bacterium]|nr:hypothetical protein [Spirochaetia bacterium]
MKVEKKTALALFVLGATAFNIAVTAGIFLALLALYSLTLAKILAAEFLMWAVIGSFVISLILSVFIYKRVLNWAREKYDLDNRFGLK